MRHQAFPDDLTDGHARVEGGVGILENDLQILTQQTDFLVLQTRQVNAVVAQSLVLLVFRVTRVGCAKHLDLMLGIMNLAIEHLDLFLELLDGRVELGGVLLLKGAVIPADSDLREFLTQLAPLEADVIALLVHVSHRGQILKSIQAADDVGHVQQGVLRGFLRGLELGMLGILLLFGKRVVSLLQLVTLGIEQLDLLTPLLQALDRGQEIARGDIIQLAAVIHRAAVRLTIELQQRAPKGGLAAAGFTHQAEDLTLVDIQADTVVGLDVKTALFQREVLLEVADAQQNLFIFLHGVPSCPGRSSESAAPH